MVGTKILEINTVPDDLNRVVTRFADIFASMTWGDPAQELHLDQVHAGDDNYFASFSSKAVISDPKLTMTIEMFITIFFEIDYKKEILVIKQKIDHHFEGQFKTLFKMMKKLLNRYMVKYLLPNIKEAVDKALERF